VFCPRSCFREAVNRPLTKEDLRRAFKEIESWPLKVGRVIMDEETAKEIHDYSHCPRCGGYFMPPSDGAVHGLKECDEEMVKVIMES